MNFQLTKSQPRLLNLQINPQVSAEADIRDESRLFLVVVIFPVTVPYAWRRTHNFHFQGILVFIIKIVTQNLNLNNQYVFLCTTSFTISSSGQDSDDQDPDHDWSNKPQQQQEQQTGHHRYQQPTEETQSNTMKEPDNKCYKFSYTMSIIFRYWVCNIEFFFLKIEAFTGEWAPSPT